VVAFRTSTALALLGLSRGPSDARSLSAVGIVVPISSLPGLGLSATARVVGRNISERLRSPADFVEFVMRPHVEGLDPIEIKRLVDQCISGADLEFEWALAESMIDLDLRQESRPLPVPALFFQPPDWVTAFPEGEGIQLFKYFAPQAEVRQLRYWPREPEGTSEVSEPIIEFVHAVEHDRAT
jgi:hypothetical protein